MKKLLLLCLMSLVLFGCSDSDDKPAVEQSENDVDAARNFIRAALDGRWTDARSLMIQDSTNSQYIDMYEELYQTKMKQEDKRGYREANITFYGKRTESDSVVVVNYSNTYKNQKDSLKVVRNNGQWLVDLKYSFQARGKDSVQVDFPNASRDSLQK
jgi:hypothetical protein